MEAWMKTDQLEILPSLMGLLRFPMTRGYFEGLGEAHRKPCTCTDDCRVLYCTGKECGCEACAIELGHKITQDEAAGEGGFALTYEGAVARYGENVADDFSPLWSDQDALKTRFLRLASRLTRRPLFRRAA
jgi:hypothetical protein